MSYKMFPVKIDDKNKVVIYYVRITEIYIKCFPY